MAQKRRKTWIPGSTCGGPGMTETPGCAQKNTVIPDAAQRRSGIQLLLPWPLDDGSGGFRVCCGRPGTKRWNSRV